MTSLETFETFVNHPLLIHPNFSKLYSRYCRVRHHYMYLVCLFTISDM